MKKMQKNGFHPPSPQLSESQPGRWGVSLSKTDFSYPKDDWTLKTGDFEDPTPSMQVLSPFHWRVQDP